MSTLASVGIHNNLTASQARIAMRTTYNKLTRRVNVIDNITVEQVLHMLSLDCVNHARHQHLFHIITDDSEHLLISLLLSLFAIICRQDKLIVLS